MFSSRSLSRKQTQWHVNLAVPCHIPDKKLMYMYYMYLKGDGTQILYTKQQYDNEYKYFKNAYF